MRISLPSMTLSRLLPDNGMKKNFTDQLNRTVEISYPPKRIISIVPSQTELLFYLGLDKEIIGITKFCIHPKNKFRDKLKIGGTKKLNLDKIRELNPDLIIGNKEENEKGQIESLAEEFPVWMSDVNNLEQALDMIRRVGDLTGKHNEAEELVHRIEKEFQKIKQAKQLTVAYFIWRNPYMVVGSWTFIHDMLQRSGWINVFGNRNRYPEVTIEAIRKNNPEVILLSSEPYPFKTKHIDELQQVCPESKIVLVDGEMFSWYGNRLLEFPDYMAKLVKEL